MSLIAKAISLDTRRRVAWSPRRSREGDLGFGEHRDEVVLPEVQRGHVVGENDGRLIGDVVGDIVLLYGVRVRVRVLCFVVGHF